MKVNVQSFRVVHAMLEILSQGTHGLCFFFLIPCECASHNMIWVSESLLSGSCKVYMYDIWIYGWILNMFRTYQWLKINIMWRWELVVFGQRCKLQNENVESLERRKILYWVELSLVSLNFCFFVFIFCLLSSFEHVCMGESRPLVKRPKTKGLSQKKKWEWACLVWLVSHIC